MDAHIYKDELGTKVDIESIPADMAELAAEYRETALEPCRTGRRSDGQIS